MPSEIAHAKSRENGDAQDWTHLSAGNGTAGCLVAQRGHGCFPVASDSSSVCRPVPHDYAKPSRPWPDITPAAGANRLDEEIEVVDQMTALAGEVPTLSAIPLARLWLPISP